VTDAGLASLVALPLDEITLYHCFGITDAGFEQLGKIKTLRQFSVRAMPLSGSGLGHLKAAGKLTVLRLNETGVNDAALEQLRGLTSLTRLELRQTPVTDGAVAALSTLGKLKALDIGQTQITADGVAKLKAALPQCKITMGTN
jgi:hypothetical protein